MKAAKELKIEGLSSFEPDEMTKVDEFDGLLVEDVHTNTDQNQETLEYENDVGKVEVTLPNIKHERLDSTGVTSAFPCSNCDYIAKKVHHLKTHQLSKHDGVKYPCSQCELKFTQSASLRRHKTKQHSML